MELNTRQSDIRDLLLREGHVSVRTLAAKFFVSEMTIRRDLREMERCGYLRRYNGGAIAEGDPNALPIQDRLLLDEEEKRNLGRMTEKYLRDGMSLFLDSSSTCAYIIPYLRQLRGIRIITNSVASLMQAAELHIPCTLTGGNYYEHDRCLVGQSAVHFLRNVNVDTAFFSTQALSDDGLITDDDEAQNEIRRAALANCRQSVFLFTRAKLHQTCLYTLCRREDVTEVILL